MIQRSRFTHHSGPHSGVELREAAMHVEHAER
jgi:hypothetical protein